MRKEFPSLSVCMIVKNEERNLPRVLESIKGLADEIVVVDTGSEDSTVRIAEEFGARVFHFPWCDDFSAARNESLKHAKKDFILWLDGDDELKRSEHDKIRGHLQRHPGSGVYLRTYIEGEGQALQLRIFPNHRGIRFEGRIHEQAIHSLQAKGIPAHVCEAAVIHHGYEEPEELIEKLRRNRKVLEEELAANPRDLDKTFFLGRTCLGLGDIELALSHFGKVIDRFEEDPSVRTATVFYLAFLDKATILDQTGRSEEALSVLSYGKSLFPESPLIHYLLGKLHFEKKEYAKAFDELLSLKDETFEKEMTPMNVPEVKKWLYRALGVSALFKDNLTVAEECFLRTIESDPSDGAGYHHLALSRERRGDVEGAIAACRMGMERADNAYLRKRLFLLLVKGEAFDQALECYKTLNGGSMDLDALAGRFLLGCRALDAAEIQSYYKLLQEKLSLVPLDFPQNLQVMKERLKGSDEGRSGEFFDAAVAFLLTQTP
jgi:glycosyltransferase involved in cell wall biosynthesis